MSNSHGDTYKFPGCLEIVPPHWDTGLEATTETCHRPLPCSVHSKDLTPEVDKVLGFGRQEMVNHPKHYGGDTVYEAIKVIEAWKLGFNLGSALKYICRAEHHGTQLEDLQKARWYVNREGERLERENNSAKR